MYDLFDLQSFHFQRYCNDIYMYIRKKAVEFIPIIISHYNKSYKFNFPLDACNLRILIRNGQKFLLIHRPLVE